MRTKRTLVGVSIAILLAATTLLTSSGDAATPAERTASVQAGADWLASQFTSDGFIPTASDTPDYSNTAQSALALGAAVSHQATFDAAVAFLQAHVDDYVGTARAATTVSARSATSCCSPTPRACRAPNFGGQDLVARLQATLGDFEPGLYGATDPSFDGAFRQGFAILGLVSQGVAPDPSADHLVDRSAVHLRRLGGLPRRYVRTVRSARSGATSSDRTATPPRWPSRR